MTLKAMEEEVVSFPPKPRQISVIRREIEEARLKADVPLLEGLLIEGTGHDRRRGEFLTPLARLYDEASMPEDALAIWRTCFAEEPSLEAAYQILRRGRDDDRRTVAPMLEEAFSEKAARAVNDLLHHGPTEAKKTHRHLAICGVSYCGSTLLGHILGGLEGFHDIGESHWLINRREIVDGRREIDFFAPSTAASWPHCRQCGEACDVLSTPFRIEMQLHRRQWYARLAERLQTDILVSSDKNSVKYVSLDPLLRFDAVVLFKSPLQAWQSFRKRLPTDDPEASLVRLEQFINSWIREYRNALLLQPKGRKLFLHFDTLVNAPTPTVARLLELLHLPKGETALETTSGRRHSIGGNEGFVDASRKAGRVDIRRPEDVALPEEHRRIMADHEVLWGVFDELQSRSALQFGAS